MGWLLSLATISSAVFAQQAVWAGASATTTATTLATSSIPANTISANPASGTTTIPSDTFTNPVLYEDFADNDIFKGPDGLFYYSASNMHFSPGAPILRSYDLVDWELIGHSVPSLDFGTNYDLIGGNAYRGGTWASTLRYRASTGLWYWIGCVNFWVTYIYTAPDPAGPWKQAAQLPGGTCYYDCGLLIDDDDKMYVVYGATNVSVAQLASDGLSQVTTRPVFGAADVGANGLEGNRLYKRNGLYYVFDDNPNTGTTYIWKSTSPWGPYDGKAFVSSVQSPVAGGSTPDQGSLIEMENGDWYFMSFTWAYPLGRMPILAPVTWGSDGFPILNTSSDGAWSTSYPRPLPAHPLSRWTGTDTFNGTALGPAWEWNHNPDSTKFKVNSGLTLSTATVTNDLFSARNTLTHRLDGPFPVGTIAIDFTNMTDGDRAGLSVFRDESASIGVWRSGNTYTVTVVEGMTQDETTWATTSNGTVVTTAPINGTKVWLRASLDSRSAGTQLGNFSYSTDGSTFANLGPSYSLSTLFNLFVGYRFAIFNHATQALGGSIAVSSFTSA